MIYTHVHRHGARGARAHWTRRDAYPLTGSTHHSRRYAANQRFEALSICVGPTEGAVESTGVSSRTHRSRGRAGRRRNPIRLARPRSPQHFARPRDAPAAQFLPHESLSRSLTRTCGRQFSRTAQSRSCRCSNASGYGTVSKGSNHRIGDEMADHRVAHWPTRRFG